MGCRDEEKEKGGGGRMFLEFGLVGIYLMTRLFGGRDEGRSAHLLSIYVSAARLCRVLML